MPFRFVDQQMRGPFAGFRHDHLFDVDPRGTGMVANVTFVAPLGAVGRIAERLVLARYVRRLSERRGEFLRRQAEADTSEP